jgi:hypothetical protein
MQGRVASNFHRLRSLSDENLDGITYDDLIDAGTGWATELVLAKSEVVSNVRSFFYQWLEKLTVGKTSPTAAKWGLVHNELPTTAQFKELTREMLSLIADGAPAPSSPRPRHTVAAAASGGGNAAAAPQAARWRLKLCPRLAEPKKMTTVPALEGLGTCTPRATAPKRTRQPARGVSTPLAPSSSGRTSSLPPDPRASASSRESDVDVASGIERLSVSDAE